MIIRFMWKNCKNFNEQDAYWVECREAEAKEKIFQFLSEDDFKMLDSYGRNAEHLAEFMDNPGYTHCFLISKDATFFQASPVHYPVHQLWNGYSPFRVIDKIEITELSELKDIEPIVKKEGESN